MKKEVLFICVHNSARSQMAEAFPNRLGQDRFEAISAGLEPTTINPLVVEVMRSVGYDLASKQTQGGLASIGTGAFSTRSLSENEVFAIFRHSGSL